ncbi:hypothetical protein [Cryobacterium sp. Y62]|uniref:hypothetical protein n=1 Tax=Cryobacterium sp. Y62 TaxID=2048284 RepID=UPI0011B06CF4|nr:hypothetical protein [Cryobacterium sp. Y62]
MNKRSLPTQAMLAAIGSVAGESANLEERVRDLFCYLIDSPYGRVLAAGEDLSNVLTSCMRAARYNRSLSELQIEKLVTLVKAANALRPMRNFLVHARWERGSQPGIHWGINNGRASPHENGKSTDDLQGWSVSDARGVADSYRTLSKYVDDFLLAAPGNPTHEHLMRRGDWQKMSDAMSKIGEILLPRDQFPELWPTPTGEEAQP